MESIYFTLFGEKHIATAKLIDSAYGPETQYQIRCNGKLKQAGSEPSSLRRIVGNYVNDVMQDAMQEAHDE